MRCFSVLFLKVAGAAVCWWAKPRASGEINSFFF